MCLETTAEDVEPKTWLCIRESILLGAGTEGRASSAGGEAELSAKSQSRPSSNSSRASAKIVELVELLAKVSKKALKGVQTSQSSSGGASCSEGRRGSLSGAPEGSAKTSEDGSKKPEGTEGWHERELGEGCIGLLDVGADEGVGSERRRVDASIKLKSERSNSSRMSAKVVEIVELLVGASGKVQHGAKAL